MKKAPRMEAKPDAAALSALPPKSKPYKTGISQGLYLLTTPTGSKLWRLKFYFQRQERTLALGAFPAISLEQAQEAASHARQQLAEGIDPCAVRKAERAARPRAGANAFRLAMSTGQALTIETPRQTLRLTPEQTAAVRAFLLAADTESNSHAAD